MEEYRNIGRYISYFYRMGQCYINEKLEPYHIGSGQYTYLLVLFDENGISQETLSERIKIDKATTGRAIKKLMQEGYVYRKRDSKDKRRYQIFLTPKGNEIKAVVYDVLEKWNELVLQDMKTSEKKYAVELLRKMADNISQFKNKETSMEEEG